MQRDSRSFSFLLAASAFLGACSNPDGPPSPTIPVSLIVVSGDQQHGVAGEELPAPVVIQVLDSADNPVSDQIVNFRVTAGGGSVFAGTAITNATGTAQEVWTLGPTPFEAQALEARAVDPTTGAPLLFGTITAIAEPGSTGLTFEVVKAGGLHSCGLTAGGQAYCWGNNGSGALGNPQTTSFFTLPTAVTGGLTFSRVATGLAHTCALTSTGAAYCWGDNSHGQLGNGTTNPTAAPTLVSGGLVFQEIEAGWFHTCAITATGAAYCWGANDYPTGNDGGQLGDSTVIDRHVPTAVRGGHAFQALALGSYFTCGLTAGGAAYCWGSNDGGNLGNGSSGTGANAVVPTAVNDSLVFTTITAATGHVCGLIANGDAYCWGSNVGGQLGTGTLSPSTDPVPVLGGLSFAAIAAGGYHTCGLTSLGALVCWGWYDGSLDSRTFNHGTSIHSTVPVTVPGTVQFASIREGDSHGCGVTSNQAAYCWFNNENGALGTGTFTGSYQPVAVR